MTDRFSFCRRDVADQRQQPSMIEPIHPDQRRRYHCFLRRPGATLNQITSLLFKTMRSRLDVGANWARGIQPKLE